MLKDYKGWMPCPWMRNLSLLLWNFLLLRFHKNFAHYFYPSNVKCVAQANVDSPSCTASANQGTAEAAMRPLVQWLVSNLSYVPGETLFGAAFDWRQHPFACLLFFDTKN